MVKKKQLKQLKNKKAFTIVELIITVVVVAVLMGIAVTTYSGIREDARDSARYGSAVTISEALEKYYERNGGYPSVASIVNTTPGNTGDAIASKLSVPAESLIMPNMSGTNPFTSNTQPSDDMISYIGESSENNASCQNDVNGSCESFVLKYVEESGETRTLESRQAVRETIDTPELSVASSGFEAIDASWTDMSGATSYTLQYSQSSDMTSASADTYPSNSGTVSGLSANTTYHFRVRSIHPNGTSEWSDVESATTGSIPAPSLTVTSSGPTAISVSWSTVSGATSYNLQRSLSSTMSSATTSSHSSTPTSASGLTADTTYYFRIQTVHPSGTSDWSDVESATTNGVPGPTGTLNIEASRSGSTMTGTASGGSCITGATIERQIRYNATVTSTAGTWSSYTSGDTRSLGGSEGYKYTFQQRTRCALSGKYSGWSYSGTDSEIRPVSQPSGLQITATMATSTTARGAATGGSCPSGTSKQTQIRYAATNVSGTGTWQAYTSGTTRDVPANQGWKYTFQQQTRCAGTHSTSGWASSSTAFTTRDISTRHVGGSVSVSTSGNYTTFEFSGNNSCPVGTTAIYAYRYMSSPGDTYPNSWDPGHPDYGNPPHNWNVPGTTSRSMTWYTGATDRKYHVHYQTFCRTYYHDGPWMKSPDGHAGAYYRP